MVIRAKRKKPRREVAREYAQLQDLQKEDNLSPETELTRSTPVLMMGIRNVDSASNELGSGIKFGERNINGRFDLLADEFPERRSTDGT